MADPLLFVDNQAAAIRRLEERVRALESTNRLLSSAIKEGRLTVLNGAGGEEIIIGLQDDGHYGILAGASQAIPAIDVDNVDGMSYPTIPVPFLPTSFQDVTSSTFTFMPWSLVALQVGYKGLRVRIGVNTSPATTGEIYISSQITGAPATTVRVVPADQDPSLILEYWWLHQTAIGGELTLTIWARRASGVGTFRIYQPTYSALIGPEHCSTAGTYVP